MIDWWVSWFFSNTEWRFSSLVFPQTIDDILFLAIDESCIFFLWLIDETRVFFSHDRWMNFTNFSHRRLTNFMIFTPWTVVNFKIFPLDILVKLASFLHVTDGRIKRLFSRDRLKNFLIFFRKRLSNFSIFQTTDWQIPWYFPMTKWRNLRFIFHDWWTYFIASKMTVRTTGCVK